ncbi:ATP-dependent nuclease [Echinicola vietnamensis]|uniref:Putative ATP-dependent endonuclease of the OLD family n=1 Tax=Echinicola vietnamensis (strain DSM 17526 / LMG 23754 / KMM 6221) TaxID=926556 RepID=L0FTV2_ECHVK|nr:AAA family ATPase [Echinicola vietnamensis]AGA76727.1 putative ATP-dependent endonuclease of the OLD family [Echinicola vietnamensis DSM 17526]
MRVAKLNIKNFRGVSSAEIYFSDHVVLIGDNNTGKSTIFEALDLTLGPDRVNRKPVVDEHDFYNGLYLTDDETDNPVIEIESLITNLSLDQQSHFKDYVEWWNIEEKKLHTSPPPKSIDNENIIAALRVSFVGQYEEEEDDFIGSTYFSRTIAENDRPLSFTKKDKQRCGFLYLRTLRTGSRALSLEKGSLLDIILRLKDLRPQMWENTITELNEFNVATDPELGISGILESIETAIKKFVPKEWGITPHLKVSNLTREHIRKIITAFIATGSGEHAAPFYRQGTGTINILVLAMLSQIAEEKQNVIFAMEEPEIAIPPYTQKHIIHEIKKLSSQSLFSTHSPYVIEEFHLSQTIILSRDDRGILKQSEVKLPDGIKLKTYRQEFRQKFSEGLLARRIIIAEGHTETASLPAVARRLSELNPDKYSSLEALGVCIIDAGSESKITALAKLYGSLGKRVFALCDKQSNEAKKLIEDNVEKLFMHSEKGFENLVLKNTTIEAMERFCELIDWPSHIIEKHPEPKNDIEHALLKYFLWAKGNWGIADFLSQCKESEIPDWLCDVCIEIKDLYELSPEF